MVCLLLDLILFASIVNRMNDLKYHMFRGANLRIRLMVLLVLILIMAGCANQQKDNKVTLKVLYYSAEEFMASYGALYQASNNNIEFEIIALNQYLREGLSEEKYLEIVEHVKPDIIFGFNYERFVDEGKLLNLEPYLKKSSDFHIDQLNSHLLHYLRLYGDGSIYALSPTFVGKAVYYNKSIFDELHIQYPHDGMSWNEILDLSKRVQVAAKQLNKDRISFYYDRNLFELATNIAKTKGIQYIDETGNVTFSTEGWHSIMELVFEYAREEAVFTRDVIPNSSSTTRYSFAEGNVAMTEEYSFLLEQLIAVNFDWGVVTVPTESVMESYNALETNALFGVYRDSGQYEHSVDFIKYINGEQFALLNQKSKQLSSLPSRQKFADDVLDVDLQAFYKVAPKIERNETPYTIEQMMQFYDVVNEILIDAVPSEVTIDELLGSLQDAAELMLRK